MAVSTLRCATIPTITSRPCSSQNEALSPVNNSPPPSLVAHHPSPVSVSLTPPGSSCAWSRTDHVPCDWLASRSVASSGPARAVAAVRTSFKAASRLLSAWTPPCPSIHLSGPWGCFLLLAAAITRPWTQGARDSLKPCFPPGGGGAGSCADVDSQTQELSPTALAGEVLVL